MIFVDVHPKLTVMTMQVVIFTINLYCLRAHVNTDDSVTKDDSPHPAVTGEGSKAITQ